MADRKSYKRKKKHGQVFLILGLLLCLVLTALIGKGLIEKRFAGKTADSSTAVDIITEPVNTITEIPGEVRTIDRSSWNLILVNTDNAIPDGYTVDTAPTRDGQEVDARIVDSLEKMLSD